MPAQSIQDRARGAILRVFIGDALWVWVLIDTMISPSFAATRATGSTTIPIPHQIGARKVQGRSIVAGGFHPRFHVRTFCGTYTLIARRGASSLIVGPLKGLIAPSQIQCCWRYQFTLSLVDSLMGRGFKPSSAKVSEGSKCMERFVSRTPVTVAIGMQWEM